MLETRLLYERGASVTVIDPMSLRRDNAAREPEHPTPVGTRARQHTQTLTPCLPLSL
jgi:hypothetical protein